MLKINFFIYYEIDEEEAKTVLRLEDYNTDEEGAWVLLEPIEAEAGGSGGTH